MLYAKPKFPIIDNNKVVNYSFLIKNKFDDKYSETSWAKDSYDWNSLHVANYVLLDEKNQFWIKLISAIEKVFPKEQIVRFQWSINTFSTYCAIHEFLNSDFEYMNFLEIDVLRNTKVEWVQQECPSFIHTPYIFNNPNYTANSLEHFKRCFYNNILGKNKKRDWEQFFCPRVFLDRKTAKNMIEVFVEFGLDFLDHRSWIRIKESIEKSNRDLNCDHFVNADVIIELYYGLSFFKLYGHFTDLGWYKYHTKEFCESKSLIHFSGDTKDKIKNWIKECS